MNKQTKNNLRFALCESQNWRCYYCDGEMSLKRMGKSEYPSLEHLVPTSEGGPDTMSNYAASCCGCNSGRPIITSSEWINVRYDLIKMDWFPCTWSPKHIRKYLKERFGYVTGLESSLQTPKFVALSDIR